MNARWMPVLAAVVGVLGGVGGAIAGGAVANSGQEQGFDRERLAAIQDLRIEVYGNYVATAEEVAGKILEDSPHEEIAAGLIGVIAAKGRVLMVAQDEAVARAALNVTAELNTAVEEGATTQDDLKDYISAADNFVVLARDEIEETA
jgi:hypothetical protein